GPASRDQHPNGNRDRRLRLIERILIRRAANAGHSRQSSRRCSKHCHTPSPFLLFSLTTSPRSQNADSPQKFGSAVFGTPGSTLYSILVSISVWGALNANIFAAGRLAAAASQRGYFPSVLGKNTHHALSSSES
ncbi:MAG: hypothetical protein LQ340_007073, partial [Diploschistes diacapsis]